MFGCDNRGAGGVVIDTQELAGVSEGIHGLDYSVIVSEHILGREGGRREGGREGGEREGGREAIVTLALKFN